MASLDKLAIRNIRSFDNNISVIQFHSPLTVIVGQNGSGKTTIIECLNYITTGNMPPNTKGGAFIHDPKLVNEKEVKAQVRLRFYDAKGDRYNVVRNLQVTTKKGGNLSMSTLEGLLQLDVDDKDKVGGKRKRNTTISSRCAELEEEIPRLLGVSPSILENVIFCHQEDANWPLSEPAKLKTKFDNIFEATRFTKALKHIKDLHKERVADAKADKVRLESLQEDRARATSIRDKKAKVEAERVAKDAERQRLEEQSIKVAAENTKWADAHNSFRERLAHAEALEDKEKLLRENMEALKNSMTMIEEGDEELQTRKADFQKHLEAQRAKSQKLKQTIGEKRSSHAQLDNKYKEEFGRMRSLQNEKERHETAVQNRKQLIRSISIDAGIKGFDMENLDEDEIANFLTKLRGQTDKAERNHDQLKADLRAALNELENKHSEAQGDVKAKRMQQQAQNDAVRKANVDIKRLEDELEELPASEQNVELAKKEAEEAATKLQEQLDALNLADYEDSMRTLSAKLRQAEEQKDDANQELTGLNAHADRRARLTLKENDRDSKKDILQTLMSKSNETMRKFAGRDADVNTFERDVERLVTAKDEELAAARRGRAKEERQLQQVQFDLSSKRKLLQEKEKAVADVETKVKAILRRGDETFQSLSALIESMEAALAQEQENISQAEAFVKVWEMAVKKRKNDSVCFCCNRFLEEEETPDFDKRTSQQIKRWQGYLSPEAEQELQKLKQELSEVKLLGVKEQEIQLLKVKDIGGLKGLVKEDEERLQELTQILETSAEKLDTMEREAKELAILKRNSVEAARVSMDLKTLDSEINGLQVDLATAGNTHSAEEVQASIAKLTEEIKKHKRDLKAVTDERDSARATLAQLERTAHRAEIARRDQEQQFERSRAKMAELKTLTESMKQAKEAVKRLEAELASAVTTQKRVYEELESERSEQDRRLAAAQKGVATLQQQNRQMQDAGKMVQEWIKNGGDDQLRDCENAMKEIKARMDRMLADIAKIEQEKATVDADLQQARATERNLDDNIRYRALSRSADEIKGQVDKQELNKLNEGRLQYAQKYEAGKKKENEINGNIQHLRGVIQGLGDQISSLAKDLKTHYNNIDRKYTEQLVKYKTNELANFDLEKTAKAVDAAILKYHSIKMEEINEHIRYLWSKTYQGTDIDTIMIKSDPEGGKGTKSYNYRVCMVKDTVEMDMRGRCSAGQKVLASIIIRLALSDSFSTHCGILALDEPTTNLDKDNIDALAASLADLIKERAKSNFQLIVITHDEDFLGRLGQQDVIEYYWRVSRNAQQKSEITVSSILANAEGAIKPS
ncbi:unnamed protein product [Tilletia controversa]|uniref:DNA repair protein RAD50 n=1 Tax=Tilletia controversa TaxID=13291 RepID=A0A8X7N1Y8_9BASI|nr:hypothetical protein A4X06_0g328 [Tilletia controversa]CAD6904313.1 unnamed protein product [Tilletia controversa]CAD6928229.1 unnamed protein product [Tilletia controversa]CAD6945972.1 unnamed protein product [Tilletia controversa]